MTTLAAESRDFIRPVEVEAALGVADCQFRQASRSERVTSKQENYYY